MQREFCAGVGSTLNNLGILHCLYGQHAQAEPLLTRVPVTKEKLLGLDHPDRALSVVNLVQLPVAQEQPEKAEPLYRRILAIRERAPGPSHPEVEKTPEGLANALRKLGRADEVVSLELRAKNFRAKRS